MEGRSGGVGMVEEGCVVGELGREGFVVRRRREGGEDGERD